MTVVCITGMHRSGTSLVSRIVNLLGVDLGPEADLIPAADDNPTGFWESATIKQTNDGVLRALGGTWHQPPAFEDGWEHDDRLEELRRTAIEALGRFTTSGPIGWKDPRTALTLPFWRTLTPVDKVVVVLRNPTHVAQSLALRNGFDTEKSARLWIRYTAEVCLVEPHLLVQYERLLAEPRDAVLELATYLELPMPSEEQWAKIESFVDPDLSHGSRLDVNSEGFRLAAALFDLLIDGGVERARPLLQHLSRSASVELREERAQRRVEELKRTARHLERDLAERDRKIAEQRMGLRSARERSEFFQARVDRMRADVQIAREERTQYRKVANHHKEHNAELTRQVGALERSLRTERERADEVRAERDRLVATVSDLKRDLAKVNGRLREQDHARRQSQMQYDRLRRRRSVRAALWLAKAWKPIFLMVRQVRGGRTPAGRATTSEAAPKDAKSEMAADTALVTCVEPADAQRDWHVILQQVATAAPVTVVVPVFNAIESVRRCIKSVVRYTTLPAEILLIDDASTDPMMTPLLEAFGGFEGIEVLRNDENLGFVRTVNRGFARAAGDVVVLNSDTEVGPRWLENLTLAAYSDARTASATALTDNGGAFSVPEMAAENQMPLGLTPPMVARLVSQSSGRRYPETPTGNAFCMYFKRQALQSVGVFDAERFPRGYGEENDWSMRARAVGWIHVVDDATWVRHARGASFGAEKEALMIAGRADVDQMHPDYTPRVREFVRSEVMAEVRDGVRLAYEAVVQEARPVAPRVLFVIHAGMGGTPHTNEDLMRALEPGHQPYVLYSDTRTVTFGRFGPDGWREIAELQLKPPLEFGETTRPEYRELVAALFVEHSIELVHVRHLFKHTFDALNVAAILRIPVVLSLHDYYLVCPTVHLLDEQDRFCGGVCTPGQGNCRLPSQWLRTTPHLKHGWVYVWQRRVAEAIEHVDAFVTTSPTARDIYMRTYSVMRSRPFEIIEHGRDLVQSQENHSPPVPGGPVRILVPGNLDVHKGARLIRRLVEVDDHERLEFHFMGEVPAPYADLGTVHGPYERGEFTERVRKISPSFIGLFSIWAETYAHTLTEAWMAGVPVLTTDFGALGERVRAHGGGWLVDHEDVEKAYRQILAIADDPQLYWDGQRSANVEGLPSTQEMADRYASLYQDVLRRRQVVSDPDPASSLRAAILRTTACLPGQPGAHPGSTYIRSLLPLWHPALREHVAPRRVSVDAFVKGSEASPDVVYVQRTAISPGHVEAFLARCEDSRLIVDLDDNLLDLSDRPDLQTEYLEASQALSQLVSVADLVTVSTPALARAIAEHAKHVAVLPNQLDEALWFGPLDQDAFDPPPDREARSGFQLLYMGTFTHGHDLAILRAVLERLHERGLNVALTVVGGEKEGPGQEWYSRIVPPKATNQYPGFVRWLRTQAPRWDIALSPLADTTFNVYKSDIKFLDYAALGLPGVYSDVEAYRTTIDPGVHGLLAPWDVEAWAEQIARLCTDRPLRRHIQMEAHRYVREQRTIAANVTSHVECLHGALRVVRGAREVAS